MLDIPIGTVMSRLHRGRKAMQTRVVRLRRGTRPHRARCRGGRLARHRRIRHMADCNETLRELEAFLDGELSDEARGAHPPAPRRLRRLPPGVRLPRRAEARDPPQVPAPTRCRPACCRASSCASTPTSTATAPSATPNPGDVPAAVCAVHAASRRASGYSERMLAAYIWHWWIGRHHGARRWCARCSASSSATSSRSRRSATRAAVAAASRSSDAGHGATPSGSPP